MIQALSRHQNWAKIAPWMAIVTTILLFLTYHPTQAMFWALVNIPMYLFHQTEEHLWPGGFKDYINQIVYGLPAGQEKLTDVKVFWINILFVWMAFSVFGFLSVANLGFGLLIVIFSLMNCATHIIEGIKRRRWNPGLVMASIQTVISIYAAWFITAHGLIHGLWWWIGTVIFSALAHLILFKFVMASD